MTTQERREQDNAKIIAEVERYNETPGNLNVDHIDAHGNAVRGDGIDCEACLNKGHRYVVMIDDKGNAQRFYQTCVCMKRRLAVKRLQESGMERAVRRYTFEAFKTESEWQRQMKETALNYLRDGVKDGAWLYIGGQSGCGKTMICTAAVGVILRKLAVRYMAWPHEAQRIKALVMDAEKYEEAVEPLRTAELLFVDDFWKPTLGRDGEEAGVTAADVRLAFDVLNYRYINALPTIISSEWFSSELGTIDSATAGRIAEMTGDFKVDIARNADRNYRLKESVI